MQLATKRLIDSVWTVAFVYEVANPQNVFSYGEIPKGEQS